MKPSLTRLTSIYFRTGNSTFGGGDPSMAVLQAELVHRTHWLPPEKYGLVYALARITPGTNLLAFCAGTAWELMGWSAALLAVAATTVPSAMAVLLLTRGYEILKSNPLAMGAIAGTLAAAVGMMAAGAWQLIRPRFSLRALVLAGGALLCARLLGISPIPVLAGAALLGVIWRR